MSCVSLSGSRKLACISGEAGILAISIGQYDSLVRVVTTSISAGRAEVANLELTGTVTTAGNVTVTLDGVVTNIAVLLNDTATAVATKVRNTVFAGFTTSGTGSAVIFTSTSFGDKADAIYSANATGAVGVMTTTVQGLAVSSGGVVTILPKYGASSLARLEVKSTTANYVENGVSGGDNRSKGVTGNLPVIFNVPKGDAVKTVTKIKELLNGEVVLFIERKDGTITVAGSQNGAMAITVDDQTGGTIGDLNGFTVTFQTMEPDFSREYLLTSTALTQYAAALKVVD